MQIFQPALSTYFLHVVRKSIVRFVIRININHIQHIQFIETLAVLLQRRCICIRCCSNHGISTDQVKLIFFIILYVPQCSPPILTSFPTSSERVSGSARQAVNQTVPVRAVLVATRRLIRKSRCKHFSNRHVFCE